VSLLERQHTSPSNPSPMPQSGAPTNNAGADMTRRRT
jgi:hypothetical protein